MQIFTFSLKIVDAKIISKQSMTMKSVVDSLIHLLFVYVTDAVYLNINHPYLKLIISLWDTLYKVWRQVQAMIPPSYDRLKKIYYTNFERKQFTIQMIYTSGICNKIINYRNNKSYILCTPYYRIKYYDLLQRPSFSGCMRMMKYFTALNVQPRNSSGSASIRNDAIYSHILYSGWFSLNIQIFSGTMLMIK